MKTILKKIIIFYLGICTKIRLILYNPKIIAITGSVGKTSTKDAIYDIISLKYNCIKSKGSFNTEFGLPLTVLQIDKNFDSCINILFIIFISIVKAFIPFRVKYLILEMGAEKKGDISYLSKLARPDISIITSIAKVHIDEKQFKNIDEIREEKLQLGLNLKKGGLLILNGDNKYLKNLDNRFDYINKIYYGFDFENDFHGSMVNDIDIHKKTEFNIHYDDNKFNFQTNIIGDFNLYSIMSAILLGLYLDIDIKKMENTVLNMQLPNGRLNKIEGIKDTTILDSSYNSSPFATKIVLEFFAKIKAKRKIMVLGNMNELGKESQNEHIKLGNIASKSGDILLCVGENAKYIMQGAISSNFKKENIYIFEDSISAGEFLKDYINTHDLILFKGSQNNVRLEKAIKMIMKNPNLASELLVRQSNFWERK